MDFSLPESTLSKVMLLELVALLGVICFVLVMRLLNPSKWVHESIVIV